MIGVVLGVTSWSRVVLAGLGASSGAAPTTAGGRASQRADALA